MLACLGGREGTGAARVFSKTLKQEEIDARSYHTMEELEQHVAEFIEQIYKPRAPALGLGLLVACGVRKPTGAVRNRASVVAGGTKLAPS